MVVDGFVQHDADAAYFAADIGGTFKIPVGEALFYGFDACFFKFLDGVDGVTGAVALVGVYAEADMWAHGFTDEAHGTDIFFYVDSGFDFEDVKAVFEDMLTGLFGHEFGGADAYGDVILDTVGIAAKEFVNGLSHEFSHKIVHGEIDSTFGGTVSVDAGVH